MREAWRWFGNTDPVTLDDIRQAGASDVVSALYHIPAGVAWPEDEVSELKRTIESTPAGMSPLRWRVVESLAVHEDIKLGRPTRDTYIARWIETIRRLARNQIEVVCYNFMPVIDWTRTDLHYRLPTGAYTLRFDHRACAVFDLHILKRRPAPRDYSEREIRQASRDYVQMSSEQRRRLTANIVAGLPGRSTASYDLEAFRRALKRYESISRAELEANLAYFLETVVPCAEDCSIRLAIHPDDPPWNLFGLPRVVCTADDIERVIESCSSTANGLALCAGTLGSHIQNDVPELASRFGDRIFFAHLRNVERQAHEPKSFVESGHLDGDVDLIEVIRILLKHEKRLRQERGMDWSVYIRPDHGHQIMDDLRKDPKPGYSAIGRLKGLAEVRGVVRAMERILGYANGDP